MRTTPAALLEACSTPEPTSIRYLIRLLTGGGRRPESDTFELKRQFDGSTRAWCSTLADAVSFSNSRHGVILFGVTDAGERVGLADYVSNLLDPAKFHDQLAKYSNGCNVRAIPVDATYYQRRYTALFVQHGSSLTVFDRDGNYAEDGKTRSEFKAGLVYVRRNGRRGVATQVEINEILQRLASDLSSQFLARVELVASLPAGAEIIVTSPENPARGARLTTKDTGIPVTIEQASDAAPTALVELLDTAQPYATIEADIAHQVRHRRQMDPEFVVPSSTLARWYLGRHESDWSVEACELAVRSALRHRIPPNFWAQQLERGHLTSIVEDLIARDAYPDREALPFLVGAQLWDDRVRLWNLAARGSQNAIRPRQYVEQCSRLTWDQFAQEGRYAQALQHENRVLSIPKLVGDRTKAESLLTDFVSSWNDCGSAARSFAHQLDIAIYGTAPG